MARAKAYDDAVYRMHMQGLSYKQIGERLGIPKGTVASIIYRVRKSAGASEAELDATHAQRCEELRAEHAAATTWMEHIKPLHEHKKRLEAEVAAKAEELRKSREELDSYLATLKELMGGA